MNRKSYMAELRSLLSFMDPQDRARVLRRYEAMFDAAGADGEMDLIRRMGSPVRQVLQIEKQYREELDAEQYGYEEPAETSAEEQADPEPIYNNDEEEAAPVDAEDAEAFYEDPTPQFAAECGNEPDEAPLKESEDGIPAEEPDDSYTGLSEALADARGALGGPVLPDLDDMDFLSIGGVGLGAAAVGMASGSKPSTGADMSPSPISPLSDFSPQRQWPEPEQYEEPEVAYPEPDEEYDEESAEEYAPVKSRIQSDEYYEDSPEAHQTPKREEAPDDPLDGSERYLVKKQYASTKSLGRPSCDSEPTRKPVPDRRRAEDDASHRSRSAPQKPDSGSVTMAVIVSIPMLVFALTGIALSLALGGAFLALGISCGVAGAYVGGYVTGGIMTYMPDILLTAGGMIGLVGLALLLAWLGIWIMVGGVMLTVRIIGAVYRSILHKEKIEEEFYDD